MKLLKTVKQKVYKTGVIHAWNEIAK